MQRGFSAGTALSSIVWRPIQCLLATGEAHLAAVTARRPVAHVELDSKITGVCEPPQATSGWDLGGEATGPCIRTAQ